MLGAQEPRQALKMAVVLRLYNMKTIRRQSQVENQPANLRMEPR